MKLVMSPVDLGNPCVALRVRAWIETLATNERYKEGNVALRVRAWIETGSVYAESNNAKSPSA